MDPTAKMWFMAKKASGTSDGSKLLFPEEVERGTAP